MQFILLTIFEIDFRKQLLIDFLKNVSHYTSGKLYAIRLFILFIDL